jgi:NDP-sugar pyrophosphorylase family protein
MKKIDVILLAGGRATRFQEVTRDKVAKPLYLLNQVELIKYTLCSLDFSLVNKLIFALDHHAEAVRGWVEEQQLPCEVEFSYQTSPGILGATQAAVSHVTTDNFMVCNTDEIRDGFEFCKLLKAHESNRDVLATMAATVAENLHYHRRINVDSKQKITETDLRNPYYRDHPSVMGQVFIGLVVYRRAAVDLFSDAYGKEWSAMITPLVEQKNMKALVVPNIGYFNVGTPIELEEANLYVSQANFRPVLALA